MGNMRVISFVHAAFTALAFNRFFWNRSKSHLSLKTRIHNSFRDLSSESNNTSLARPLPSTFFTQADAEASFQAWSAEQSNSRGIIPVGPQSLEEPNSKQLPAGISGALM